MSNYVFVYGSLKKGFYNHDLIGDPTNSFITEGKTLDKYIMISMGSFPAIFKNPYPMSERTAKYENRISGEVYQVSDETLQRLDMLEGVPSFYKRITDYIEYENNKVIQAYVYVLANPRDYTSEYNIPANLLGEWTHNHENRYDDPFIQKLE